MLTVGAVPFLRGFAAESVAVTPSDMAAANDVEMPDDAPADSTPETDADAPARSITGTDEPMHTLTDDGSTVHTYSKNGFTAAFDTATGVLTITGSGTLTQSFIQSIRNTSALGSVFGGTKQPNVKKIVIDDDITEIGERAFEYFGGSTDGNTTVEVNGKVTKVNAQAFAWIEQIDYVIFGSTVTEMGDKVFWGSSALKTVTFANSVKKIGSEVFYNNSSLTDIYIESPSLDSWGQMIKYGDRRVSVHVPCEHFNVNGTVVTSDNKSNYINEASLVIPDDTWEWVTDTAPTCENAGLKHMECSGCHLKGDYAPIDPLGHDWGEWEGDPVQVSTCRNDESHKEYRLNPAIRFAVTAGNKSQYTLGTKKTLGLTIDRVDREDENVYTYFTNGGEVKVTGANDYSKTLTAEDFDAENGSLKITLNAAYLEGLAPGTYSLTASFKVADGYDLISSEPVSFTIVKPSPEPSSPATGERGMMTTFCIALMLLAAYGAVYAVTRRKTVISG